MMKAKNDNIDTRFKKPGFGVICFKTDFQR